MNIPELEEIVFPKDRKKAESIFVTLKDETIVAIIMDGPGYTVRTGAALPIYKGMPICKRFEINNGSNFLLLQEEDKLYGDSLIEYSEESPTKLKVIGKIFEGHDGGKGYLPDGRLKPVRLYSTK